MFDFTKFCKEFEDADDFTTIKALAVRLSQATNEIEKVTIMAHLFDAVDIVESVNKAETDQCEYWSARCYAETKKKTELKKKLEEIQKAAST